MRHTLITTLFLAASLPAYAQSSVGAFTELQRVEIADSDDLELVLGLIEQGGASQSPKHMHPRGETVYVLEGAVTVVGEGGVVHNHKAGDSFHQPPGKWYIVSTEDAGAKAIVIRVLKKGEAPTTEVE